ncbi:LOW QUALITY PROTEIN: uncharacterized protein Dmoj_GI16147 [Drosophila mojavensis]|uniref:TOG domain-containing protein n=1 Tax=Drosophila mojavensis TaxID=7230 RepID=B4KFP4_DROMO|nr:LOW QUALITY PROTEIN: uncharacterized protein Dmoj_GI16147 [Drosophila mojavensis]
MFFERILERKDISYNTTHPGNGNSDANETDTYHLSETNNVIGEDKDNNNNNSTNINDNNSNQSNNSADPNKMQRRYEQTAGAAVQLTSLWEHVLRTRRLPETICPAAMFTEFHERLQDPEWQVRQHALRVLVDVLMVMRSKADKHNMHFLIDLIKNLGHQAPTVRKGALDCLRVYLSETSAPEMVMLQILDTGLSQHSIYDERLGCGVLLSLPPLLQSILLTPQRHFIVKHVMERLVDRLQRQQTQQEIILKVLAKIRELLGVQEFEHYLDEVQSVDGLSLFNQLCNVYGILNKSHRAEGANTGAWRALPREHTWRAPSTSQEQQEVPHPEKGKVIKETEIKINDDTLTMRILEAETETEEIDSPILESAELVCRPLPAQPPREMDAGILQIISDSELEEVNETNIGTPFRGLKRVTFGGEVVKMRTPDSDAASSTHNIDNPVRDVDGHQTNTPQTSSVLEEQQQPDKDKNEAFKMTALTLEIPSDNTKPLPRPRSAQSPQRNNTFLKDQEQATQKTNATTTHASPNRDVSPTYRSRSISPAGSITTSPKVPHKEIEVLHNLQRDTDPSPRSLRRSESVTTELITPPGITTVVQADPPATPTSWEDLDIVNYKTIMDLRSGDWRNRLQGVAQLEIALSTSSNLVKVQPHLDSLLRTLLSSERHFEVAALKREVLVNLISRLPLDNLEERTPQILSGLCRQGNAGANRVCKALMQRLPAGTIVAKLTAPEYLHAKSSKFRDHALQMSIYSLMSFPGTCFDINILAAQVTYAALNRKRRVRQAALEVFSVLADISSVDEVMQIVAETVDSIESGPALLAAVKMRLSRLQLPIITTDGSVLYTFHKADQAGRMRFGADVDWITQGEGSASPNAVKRRRQQLANKKRLQESKDAEDMTNQSSPIDENLHRHSFHSPPEALDMSRASNDFFKKKMYCTNSNYMERRLGAKAYSESSMDGRSTDSTTTSCSSGSGSGSFIQLTPCNLAINRRLARQNSRFPIMKRQTDFITNFMRNIERKPCTYSFEDTKDHPIVNHGVHKSLKQQVQKEPAGQKIYVEQNWLERSSQSQAKAIAKLKDQQLETALNRDVPNGSKFKVKAEIPSQVTTAIEPQASNHNGEGSPLSIKSTSYSQKSTASAKSYDVGKQTTSLSVEMDATNLETPFGELVVDDIEEETESPCQEPALKRNESVSSLQSKTESIKTQLEDATPQMSRAQSMKSLAIEEEIESANSFVVVEDMQNELESTEVEAVALHKLPELPPSNEAQLPSASRISSSKKSEILEDDRAIHSRSISLDSLYGRRPNSKQDSLDTSTSTTDNSSQIGSHFDQTNRLPAKTQHTPLKQKSKTSYLLRGQRRVSPVKQAIKMSQTELFPPTMSSFEKPREALLKTFDQLDSNNWEVNITGLKSMVRLIRYHADFLDSHMHMTCIQLTRSVRNLRSQVARAACQVATELYTLKFKSLELECDDLVCALLHRTADTNRFLRADATRALESMVDHVQPAKVLNILAAKGAQHQNAVVRTTTAKLMFRLVERLGCDRIYSMGRENRDKFFTVGANLLLEGSLETRSYAKSLFRALSEHASYQRLLLEVIPPRIYRNVEKTLRSITR